MKYVLDHHRLIAMHRGDVEEPADERQPETADQPRSKKGNLCTKGHSNTTDNEQPGNDLAHRRSPSRGSTKVSRDCPQDRTQHSSAIKWKTWNQVEDGEENVNESHPH